MYEAFYGMKERPFALTPDPSFLFMSAKHSLALSMLEYSLMGQAGFTVVTGEIGSGKTTLIRQFLKRTDRGINLGVISNTHEAFGDLLQWVLLAFGIQSDGEDKAHRYQAFASYLISQYAAGKQTILIIDEAQNLSVNALEELRLLSNINADKDQVIQMILVGQPELLEKLKRPELTQFAQRISVHYHLAPLSALEARDYILHRLRVAGAKERLFDDAAIAAVFHFSKGVPQLINSLCDMALVYGFAQSRREIDVDIVQAVVQDREKGSLLSLPNKSGDVTREELIESAASLSGPRGRNPANDTGDPIQPTQQPLGAEGGQAPIAGTAGKRVAAMASGSIAKPDREDISSYVHREVQRLATPIIPAYLDPKDQGKAVDTTPKRRGGSRWLWWLT